MTESDLKHQEFIRTFCKDPTIEEQAKKDAAQELQKRGVGQPQQEMGVVFERFPNISYAILTFIGNGEVHQIAWSETDIRYTKISKRPHLSRWD